MTKRTIGVLGLGIFGTSIVETLKDYDCQIIAVDNRDDHINAVAPYLTQGVVGDITDLDLLQAAGIDTCDGVIVATGTSLEASVLAVMHCKTLGVKEVVAKATNDVAATVLTKIGADDVITPEKETGIAVAKQVLFPNATDVITVDDKISLVEFYPPVAWLGKQVSQVEPRRQYHINLVGFRPSKEASIDTNIGPDYIFQADQLIIAVTDNKTFNTFEGLAKLT